MSAAELPPPEFTPTSTKPYLIRAQHEWCGDNGLTPYLVVAVDAQTQVPHEFVKDGQIVLNVSMNATDGLRLGNEWIEFSARFNGRARDIFIPVARVVGIYAKENGQGMGFEPEASPAPGGSPASASNVSSGAAPLTTPQKSSGTRPKLSLVK